MTDRRRAGAQPSAKSLSANYRPELEGLRAIAAILVAVFHIWLGRVSGGVDVFFVIAGFLTTTTLLGHIRRTGRVSSSGFLLRLATRLLPAALTVLTAVALLTPLLLVTAQWRQTFIEVIASALYVENWWLLRAGNDYLARDSFLSPVQNFWAMSVQGQFYLVWLLIFLLAVAVSKLVRSASSRRTALFLVSGVSLVSFAFANVAVVSNQSAAYYNTFARAWEFGVGGLCALLLPGVVIPAILRTIAGWVGGIGIISCGFLVDAGSTFPGVWALWPTLSAALVLVAGSGAPQRLGVQRLLATRPLVWLGAISYGIYLWHWPLLIFVMEATGSVPSFVLGLAIILVAIALAWLTNRLIEVPVSRWANGGVRPKRRQLIPVGALLLVVTLVAGSLLGVNRAAREDLAQSSAAAATGGDCFGASARLIGSECGDGSWQRSVPAFDASLDYSSLEGNECRTSTTGTELKECHFGAIGSDKRVLLIGNSHAAALFPALRVLADQQGWEITTFYKSNCVFNTAPRRDEDPAEVQSCAEWGQLVRERLSELPPFLFALNSYSARKSVFLDASGAPSDTSGIQGFVEAWLPLTEGGTPVLAVADNPVLDRTQQLNCAYSPGSVGTCSVDRAHALADSDLILEAARATPGAIALDLTDVYCDYDVCPLVIGGVKVHRDKGHLTKTFASTLAPFLYDAVAALPGVQE